MLIYGRGFAAGPGSAPSGHLFLMSTLRGLPSGQMRTWAASPTKTRMSVKRMTRSHEIFRLYSSTLILCTHHPVTESLLTHRHNQRYTAKTPTPKNVSAALSATEVSIQPTSTLTFVTVTVLRTSCPAPVDSDRTDCLKEAD